MPTYDYRCDECEHEFETFQSITDKPLKCCPSCGKRKLRRLIGSGAALIFRGSGFYCTDYRKGGAGGERSGDSRNGSSGTSGDGGTDTASPAKGAEKPGKSDNGAKSD